MAHDRAGVPHVCVELGGNRTCYPGALHLPCEADTDCIGDLTCLEVNAPDENDQPTKRRRCSTPCQSDEDCKSSRFAGPTSYCRDGACAARLHRGARCERDYQCLEGICKPSTVSQEDAAQGVKRCLP